MSHVAYLAVKGVPYRLRMPPPLLPFTTPPLAPRRKRPCCLPPSPARPPAHLNVLANSVMSVKR